MYTIKELKKELRDFESGKLTGEANDRICRDEIEEMLELCKVS